MTLSFVLLLNNALFLLCLIHVTKKNLDSEEDE